MKKTAAAALTIFLSSVFFLQGCAGSASSLDPNDPVTLTMWHVYGEQAESPMNTLVEEFNNTVGRKNGVLIDVTAMSNAAAIGQQLLDAQAGKPGAGQMPDLFFCHPANAEALGTGRLCDWKSLFTESELSDFVPAFVKEGTLDDRLVVFPVAKSTHLLFLNGTVFSRFSADTGITETDLSGWEGFYRAASAYYRWSKGRPFCAFDYPLHCEMLEAESKSDSVLDGKGWFNSEDAAFRSAALRFGRALAEGTVVLSDQYSNTQVMTGEVISGISSSAAILYYNDTVTYPDNTSEALNLKVLPLPRPAQGKIYATQAGVGLCALAAEGKKAEAISLFAHWLTDGTRNLDFAAATGYMPVRNEAFRQIERYPFKSKAFQELFGALDNVRGSCIFRTDPADAGFYAGIQKVYLAVREKQAVWHARFLKGEKAENLAMEYWQLITSAS